MLPVCKEPSPHKNLAIDTTNVGKKMLGLAIWLQPTNTAPIWHS